MQIPDFILVSYVKSQRAGRNLVEDQYGYRKNSLFRWTRKYAEMLGCKWYALSPKYGFLAPGDRIEDYDLSIECLTLQQRRQWSLRVVEQLIEKERGIRDKKIELHVSASYLKYGVLEGLERAGALYTRPTLGTKRHEKVGWFKSQGVYSISD